jgi:hypothetical protein
MSDFHMGALTLIVSIKFCLLGIITENIKDNLHRLYIQVILIMFFISTAISSRVHYNDCENTEKENGEIIIRG